MTHFLLVFKTVSLKQEQIGEECCKIKNRGFEFMDFECLLIIFSNFLFVCLNFHCHLFTEHN